MRAEGAATVALVTGVGDTVGQAVVKAARAARHPVRIVGTDADPWAAGFSWVDVAARLPRCDDADAYLSGLVALCRREGVQLVLPGSEPELLLLADNADLVRRATGAALVAGRPELLRTALDKWETCRFLAAHGLRHPAFARLEDVDEVGRLLDEVGLPLLAKPRRGSGSRGVVIVRSQDDIESTRHLGVPFVLQELLGSADEEYSVETWTCQDGSLVGPVSYRREQLSAGDTYSARVGTHPEVEAEGRAVAAALGSAGPCNVQLRMTDRGPVTFEINPRFSGGVAMRAHFGFNEVEMAVGERVLARPVPRPTLTSGHVRRFWGELYRDDEPSVPRQDPATTDLVT